MLLHILLVTLFQRAVSTETHAIDHRFLVDAVNLPPLESQYNLSCTASCSPSLLSPNNSVSFCKSVIALVNCTAASVSSYSCNFDSCLSTCPEETICYLETSSTLVCPEVINPIPSASPTLLPGTTFPPTNFKPSHTPTLSPTGEPSVSPTISQAPTISLQPTSAPTRRGATNAPSTTAPSSVPTNVGDTNPPSAIPSSAPTHMPSVVPTKRPTSSPTSRPSASPSAVPTTCPTDAPSAAPSSTPTSKPTNVGDTNPPSAVPTLFPTAIPTRRPTLTGETVEPSSSPTVFPTTSTPSASPTASPSAAPSSNPSAAPTARPTVPNPTASPSAQPSAAPTVVPSAVPSAVPTLRPSAAPSAAPSTTPTVSPTMSPTVAPSTSSPTASPSSAPSTNPTSSPTARPTSVNETNSPTAFPSAAPSAAPSTVSPTVIPTAVPSAVPTATPSNVPTANPSATPSADPTAAPSHAPTVSPSATPTMSPTVSPSALPSAHPSSSPSALPSAVPSTAPSAAPSARPSAVPSSAPSAPTLSPTAVPSSKPTLRPTVAPTRVGDTISPTMQFNNKFLNVSSLEGATNTLMSGVAAGTYRGASGVFVSYDNSIGFLPDANRSTCVLVNNCRDAIIKVVGKSGGSNDIDGSFELAELYRPGRMAFDATSNKLFVVVNVNRLIRVVDFGTNTVTTVSASANNRIVFATPAADIDMDVAIVGTTLYVTDGVQIYSIAQSGSFYSRTAYGCVQSYLNNLQSSSSNTASASYLTGVTVAGSPRNALYFTVSGGFSIIASLSLSSVCTYGSDVTLVAGDVRQFYVDGGNFTSSKDGCVGAMRLAYPSSVVYDPVGDSLYFTESFDLGVTYLGSQAVRRFTFSSRCVNFHAGYDFTQDAAYPASGTLGGFAVGSGAVAKFKKPSSIAYLGALNGEPSFMLTSFLIANTMTSNSLRYVRFVTESFYVPGLPTNVPTSSTAPNYVSSLTSSIPLISASEVGIYQSQKGFFVAIDNSIQFLSYSAAQACSSNPASCSSSLVKVAGSDNPSDDTDGTFSTAQIVQPGRMRYDSAANVLYVVANVNRIVRRLDLNTNLVQTLRNSAGNKIQFAYSSVVLDVDIYGTSVIVSDGVNVYRLDRSGSSYVMTRYSSLDFLGAYAQGNKYYFTGVAVVPSKNQLYVSVSYGLNMIVAIDTSVNSTFTPDVVTGSELPWNDAQDLPPVSVNGCPSSGSTGSVLSFPSALKYVQEDDSIYFTEGFFNGDVGYTGSLSVKSLKLLTRCVAAYAGRDFSVDYFSMGGYVDGVASTAEFSAMGSISAAIASDGSVSLFVADTVNQVLRSVHRGSSLGSLQTKSIRSPHSLFHLGMPQTHDFDYARLARKLEVVPTNLVNFNNLLNQCINSALNPSILYPTIYFKSISPNGGSSSMVAAVTKSGMPGYIVCAAFPLSFDNSTLTADLIRSVGTQVYSPDNGDYSIILPGPYAPATYQVFCLSYGISNNPDGSSDMPISSVRSAGKRVTTLASNLVEFVYDSDEWDLSDAQPSNFFIRFTAAPVNLVVNFTSLVFPYIGDACDFLDKSELVHMETDKHDFVVPKSATYGSNDANTDALAFSFQPFQSGCYYFYADYSGPSASSFYYSVAAPRVSYDKNVIIVRVYDSRDPAQIPTAPQLVSATITPTGDGISVKFSHDTDQGVRMDLVPGEPFPCSKLFVFVGSADLMCQFVSPSEVIVIGTPTSTFEPWQSFSIIPSELISECKHEAAVCATYPTVPGGSVIIEPPAVPLVPVVVVTTAPEITLCSEFILSTAQSRGNGGRPWLYVSWSVNKLFGTVVTDATAYLNSLDWSQPESTYQIPRSFFTPGHKYVFVATLDNYIGNTGTSSITFVVTEDPLPSLFFVQTYPGGVSSNESIVLTADTLVNDCDLQYPLQYTWTVYENGALVTIENTANAQNSFMTAPYALTTYSTYLFEMTAQDGMGDSSVISASVYIKPGALTARISQGERLDISVTSALLLDARATIDGSNEGVDQLSFEWSCMKVQPFGPGCPSFDSNDVDINIPANTLASGAQYNFVVRAFDSSRESWASISVHVVKSALVVPVITVAIQENDLFPDDRIVNVDSTIGLSASIVFDSVKSYNAKWSVVQSASLLNVGNFSGVVDYNSFISPNTLTAGLYYTFRMSVTPYECNTCSSAYADITVYVNSKPMLGSLNVSPEKGVSGFDSQATVFTFSTGGWIDSDLPLTYSFKYQDTHEDWLPLVVRSVFPMGRSLAPIGDSSNGDKLNVKVIVTDSLGSSNSAGAQIVVAPLASNVVLDPVGFVEGLLDDAVNSKLYEELIAIASFIAGDITTVTSIDDLNSIVDLVFDAFSQLADDVDWSNSDVSIEDAANLCLIFGDSSPVKAGNLALIMKMKDFVKSISDGAVANPSQVSFADIMDIQACTNILMNATTSLSLQQSRRKLVMTVEDMVSLSTVCHDSMHGTSRVAASKLTHFAPVTLNYDYFKIQIQANQPSMWKDKIVPPLSSWGVEPDSNMYADFGAIDTAGLLDSMTGYLSIVMVMMDSSLDPSCDYDGTCEHIGILWSSLYEVMIHNPSTTYVDTGSVMLYTSASSTVNKTSGSFPEPQLNIQNCFQGDALFFACPVDYTNGVSDITLNKTCPSMGEVRFQCPVFTLERICGDSVVSEDGYCTPDASRSTDDMVTCACPPRYTTYSDSYAAPSRRLLNNRRKLYSLNAYQSFEIASSLILADQVVYPANVSFIKLVIAEKGTIATNGFDTQTFSYVFPTCVVGCCLIIGAIYFYRRYKRKQLEDKYTKDMTYTIHDFPDLLRRGRELRADNELEEAERILREAVNLVEGPDGGDIPPEDASAAYYELASVLSLLGRHEEALPLYQQAHGVFKGGKTDKGDGLKTEAVVLQIPEDDASLASYDSHDASDSSTHSEALRAESEDARKSENEISLDRIDTSSTIESTGFNANYDDFYDVLKMAGVSANIPLRQKKATRSFVGLDGVAVGAGSKLEGGFEDEATGTTSTML